MHFLIKSKIALLLASCFLVACSNNADKSTEPGSAGIHFYALSALDPVANNHSALRIGVGPIEIPRLLNRPQIITRKNKTEIILGEFNQWGGSFKEDLLQTLVDNLSSLKHTDNIEKYPWKFSYKPHYQVRINIERLDGELGKNVVLKARWRLFKNNREIRVKHSIITISIKGDKSYSRYVEAQSKALIKLSREISSQIK